MPIALNVLVKRLDPTKTILLFGAGSSIPSGAPSAINLAKELASDFKIDKGAELGLSDLAVVIEQKIDRRSLIEAVTKKLRALKPVRGLLNLPDFDWAGLYTTNYDNLIEKAYALRSKELKVISSNFDFGQGNQITDAYLYKLHGTLDKDESLGHKSQMIISSTDYANTNEYREALYAKFTEQLFTNNALIIGYSLADPDLRSVVEQALRVKKTKGAPGKITLFVYETDENKAVVYEALGLDVCFGGIDDFFAELGNSYAKAPTIPGIIDDPLDRARRVYPSTLAVSDAKNNQKANLGSMFAGRPANYADIAQGWTFKRDFCDQLETQLTSDKKRISYILGSAGSGKTTGVRKTLLSLNEQGFLCWEHMSELPLQSSAWIEIDDELRKRKQTGILFVDDAHENLLEINKLTESICKNDVAALKLILVSSKPSWNPRLKSPAIFQHGERYEIKNLSSSEIESLLDILEVSTEVSDLVEKSFSGFNRSERRRRLAERCKSDMFVCMKNIFGSDTFDDIILQEFADLHSDYQAVYKKIAGMESAGVRVHRQLVLRATSIAADQVNRTLEDLDGIIEEQTISIRQGIFSWKARHNVISDIIAKYKFSSEDELYELLNDTIENLNPSYDIELESMNDMCAPGKALSRIYNKNRQNILLRKMISLTPRLRVPRHRLITNLISLEDYENATTEIRLFEGELRIDGPVQRYKIKLLLERSQNARGILDEDRAAMIREAATLAETGIQKFQDDKNLYAVYLETGVTYLRYQPDRSIYDQAMKAATNAYNRILDPDLERTIRKFQRLEQRFAA